MKLITPLLAATIILGMTGCLHPTAALRSKPVPPLTLAGNGQTEYVIVLAPDHSPAEQHAADRIGRQIAGEEHRDQRRLFGCERVDVDRRRLGIGE